MSPDLSAMLTAASREPEQDPGPAALWRRGRRRRLTRLSTTAAGLAGVVVLGIALVGSPRMSPVIGPVDEPTPRAPGTIGDEAKEPWTVTGLGVSLDVPAAWSETDGDPLARSGPTGFVRLSVAAAEFPASQVCAREVDRAASPYGSRPDVRVLVVGDEEACMIRPTDPTAALAVVAIPLPPDLGSAAGRAYLFVHADADHIDGIVRSLRFTAVRR